MKAVCNKCHKEKDANEFYKNSKYKNGRRPICKECMIDGTLIRYFENKPNVICELCGKLIERNTQPIINKYHSECAKNFRRKYPEYTHNYYLKNIEKIRRWKHDYWIRKKTLTKDK